VTSSLPARPLARWARQKRTTPLLVSHIIRARKKTANVPIIFLTAHYDEDQHINEGYDAGAVD
jgi:DNA-binding response OmpR family regulator